MKNQERAIQIWQVLIGLAHNRQTITDEKVAELIGMQNKLNELIEPLKLLMNYCKINKLPPLTYLIVLINTDIYEQSIRLVGSWDKDRKEIFSFGWYKMKPIGKDNFTILL